MAGCSDALTAAALAMAAALAVAVLAAAAAAALAALAAALVGGLLLTSSRHVHRATVAGAPASASDDAGAGEASGGAVGASRSFQAASRDGTSPYMPPTGRPQIRRR